MIAAELAEERAQLDKERSHLLNALEALRSSGATDAELESKLSALDLRLFRQVQRRGGPQLLASVG